MPEGLNNPVFLGRQLPFVLLGSAKEIILLQIFGESDGLLQYQRYGCPWSLRNGGKDPNSTTTWELLHGPVALLHNGATAEAFSINIETNTLVRSPLGLGSVAFIALHGLR